MKGIKKRILFLTFLICVLFGRNLTASAENDEEVYVFINGEEILFEVPPIVTENGDIIAPIISISEAIGDEVLWNEQLKSMAVKHEKEVLIADVNQEYCYVARDIQWEYWDKIQLETPILYINNQMYISIISFCEALSIDVDFEKDTNTIYMYYRSPVSSERITADDFENIDTMYYILNEDVSQFELYSEDFMEFYNQRISTIDAVAMGVSDIWAGVQELLSGLSNSENIMKNCLELMLDSIPDNSLVTVDTELYDDIKDYLENGKSVFDIATGVDDDFLKMHPELNILDSSIENVGYIYDFTLFSTEQIAILLSSYKKNIGYLDTLESVFQENNCLNDEIRISISTLKEEYTNKFLQIMVNLRDELTKFTISEGADMLTGGVFSIGEFAWDKIFSFTGTTEKGQALKNFYGLFCINVPLDVSYKSLYTQILDGTYNIDDLMELRQLDDMQRALKVELYESIRNITNDKATREYCEKMMKGLSTSCVFWNKCLVEAQIIHYDEENDTLGINKTENGNESSSVASMPLQAYQGIFMKNGMFLSIALYTDFEMGGPIGIAYEVTRPYRMDENGYVNSNEIFELGEIYYIQNENRYEIRNNQIIYQLVYSERAIRISGGTLYDGEYVQVSNSGANMQASDIWLSIPYKTETYDLGTITGYACYDKIVLEYKEILENASSGFVNYYDEKYNSLLRYVNSLTQVGYYVYDIDSDGKPELLIGEVDQTNYTGMFYDLYTLSGDEALLVARSEERSRYYLCSNHEIILQSSGSALLSSESRYILKNKSLEFVDAICYDGFQDEMNPWFYSTITDYGDFSNPITVEQVDFLKSRYQYISIPFVPFSNIAAKEASYSDSKESYDAIEKLENEECITEDSSLEDDITIKSEDSGIDKNVTTEITTSIDLQALEKAYIGDHIFLGRYEQDGDLTNGPENIEWRILDIDGSRKLLLSEKVLDKVEYNEGDEKVTWETCSLRKWLNESFLFEAFNDEERSYISLSQVSNSDNIHYGTIGGNTTQDYIFALSLDEIYQYFPSAEDRRAKATQYARDNHLYAVNDKALDKKMDGEYLYSKEDMGCSMWYLRSPGRLQRNGSYIVENGKTEHEFEYLTIMGSYGVRPALWVNSPGEPKASDVGDDKSVRIFITTSDVNLREGCSTDTEILSVIPQNSRVAGYGWGEEGEWIKIFYNIQGKEVIGYIKAEYAMEVYE